MSLVVAKVIDSIIRIESDSKITAPNAVQSNPFAGVIKSIILSPKVCISYAGNLAYADKALKQVFRKDIVNDVDALTAILLDINKESIADNPDNNSNQTDFIITSSVTEPQLIKISEGNINKNSKNAWIGDYRGFECYQRSFHQKIENNKAPSTDELFMAQSNAFKEVIDESSIESIGHFQISISNNNKLNEFRYLLKSIIHSQNQTVNIPAKDAWVMMPMGNAEEGSYGECHLVTESSGVQAIGIHFPFGYFGALFHPTELYKHGLSVDANQPFELRKCQIIRDVDAKQFIEEVEGEYGITLCGLIYEFNNSAVKFINRGINYARKNKHEDAIEEYNIAVERYPNEAVNGYFCRAKSYEEIGEYDLALNDLNKIQHKDEEVYNQIGIVCARQNKVQESLYAFKKALEIKPNYSPAIRNLKNFILVRKT